ncbi:hypothetical protein [Aquimarina longa]|uniref:hypothetical protein n=1 Tax=Aquimarina longa TaxID=1080221 RepID=UPI00078176B1|nr:hypothetical protein [Aquimarina longa]
MKKFFLLLTIFILLISCSIPKKLELEYIDSIEVRNIGFQSITLNTNAVFNNPNNIKGKLSIDSIHVFIDNIDVGTLSSKEFDVPKKNNFSIPLEGTFSLSKVYKENKNSILGSVLKAIQTDSLSIHYKGIIRYHLGNFSYPYTVEKDQMVSLKKN